MPFLIPVVVAIAEGASTWAIIGAIATATLGAVSQIEASKAKSAQQHQADTLTLQMGETPRRVLAGNAATGGDFLTAWNDGPNNDFETIVIKLSDVQCSLLRGFWIDDNAYGFTANGAQATFNVGGTDHLWIYFQPGTQSQAPPAAITTPGGANWTADHRAQGCAHIIVRYKYNPKVWVSGRPRFKWVVQGALVYDPRYDSTVAGGSGPCTWGVPSTYIFSDNLMVIAYNYLRGFYNGSELMVGYGATADQAPPARWIAGMNTCDEIVPLKAGGQEFRYHGGGVISADEPYITVLENLAECCGGILVPHQGSVEIAVGTAQTYVHDITDADLADGEDIDINPWRNTDDRVNSVTAQYNDPTQQWNSTSAPMRRVYADVVSDGKPYPATPTLIYCNSNTQAQRIAEIQRRKKRLEKTFQIRLPARFCDIEAGDWLRWTSNRYFGGAAYQFLVTAQSDGKTAFQPALTLEQIDPSCFGWVPANDEITPGTTPYVAGSARTALALSTVALASVSISGSSGSVPGLKFTWTPPTDASIQRVLMQVRRQGTTDFQSFACDDPSQGFMIVAASMAPGAAMEGRARPDSNDVTRPVTWSSWLPATVGGSTSSSVVSEISLNLHPTLQAWAGALPDNYTQSGAGTVTKDTMHNAYGDWCADYVATAAANQWLTTASTAELRIPSESTQYYVEWDFTFVSGDLKEAGVLYRVYYNGGTANYYDYPISFYDEHPSPVAGARLRGGRVVNRTYTGGAPTGLPTGSTLLWVMNWSGLSGGAVSAKEIYWHRVLSRFPGKQDRDAAAKLVNIDNTGVANSSKFLPPNFSQGNAYSRTVGSPLSCTTSGRIDIAAHTLNLFGTNYSFPAGSLTVTSGNIYDVYYDVVAGTYSYALNASTASATIKTNGTSSYVNTITATAGSSPGYSDPVRKGNAYA